MPDLILCLLAIPFGAAILVAALGPRQGVAIRWISLLATTANLVLAIILAAGFVDLRAEQGEEPRAAGAARAADTRKPTFQPEFVPGDPGERDPEGGWKPSHRTSWDLVTFAGSGETGRPWAVQFYVGLDGLNVWLVVLTALLMVPSVLVSWTAIDERVNEYYSWLLALETALLGVFVSFDIVLFYVFFELTLVPLFFLIGIWGGPERRYAARKFFIYTLTGSLLTLLGVLGVVLACYSRNQGELTFSIPRLVEVVNQQLAIQDPASQQFWHAVQFWVFLALMAGFAVKVPLVPLHTWLPLAHVEAPTAGSVLLAGVLLKIGTYGFLRLCLPLAPDVSLTLGVPLIGTLAVVGIVYGALCSLAQSDIKKLVAYSSVSHLGFCMLGMFALNMAGLSGSLLQMINHGLSTGGLFLLVGMLYERYHTRLMDDYGGMGAKLKLLACFMVFVSLSSIGLPGLNGFVGEFLILAGAFDFQYFRMQWPLLAVVGSTGIVLGAWYLLTMLMRVFFGPVKEPQVVGGHGEAHHGLVGDLKLREIAALAPIAVGCIWIGVYPETFLAPMRRDLGVVFRIVDPSRSGPAEAARQGGPPPGETAAVAGGERKGVEP